MALTTCVGLKAAVASWMHRTDLTTLIPDFISLAESDIRKDVRCQAMESLATGTLTGETLAFPTRFIEATRLTVEGDPYKYEIPVYYTAQVEAQSQEWSYTVIGQNIYILNGTNGDAYTLLYYSMFAGLSADADTNWLITNHPDVYLFGTLKHACLWTEFPEGVVKWDAMYKQAVAKVNSMEQKARYTGGPLNVRTQVVR